jgi:hypothetical protein
MRRSCLLLCLLLLFVIGCEGSLRTRREELRKLQRELNKLRKREGPDSIASKEMELKVITLRNEIEGVPATPPPPPPLPVSEAAPAVAAAPAPAPAAPAPSGENNKEEEHAPAGGAKQDSSSMRGNAEMPPIRDYIRERKAAFWDEGAQRSALLSSRIQDWLLARPPEVQKEYKQGLDRDLAEVSQLERSLDALWVKALRDIDNIHVAAPSADPNLNPFATATAGGSGVLERIHGVRERRRGQEAAIVRDLAARRAAIEGVLVSEL